jgi:hypothetical protein
MSTDVVARSLVGCAGYFWSFENNRIGVLAVIRGTAEAGQMLEQDDRRQGIIGLLREI